MTFDSQKNHKGFFKHPWQTTIKDQFVSSIKYGHNSVYNPHDKTEVKRYNAPTKFTIVGNRIAKEFIYCVKLVSGLYKYRKNDFEAPAIRGVSSVEWPQVWNDLKLQYGGLAYCITSEVAVIVNKKFIGGEKELKELIESKYSYHIRPDYYKEAIAEFTKYVDNTGVCDIVPRTCENFMRLCKTKRGGYSGTPVHRIVKDGWIQCGGFNLKSTHLDCENFIIPHDRRGVLCMANDGRHKDCSTQFFVLLQPAPWMDQRYVAFGQLIDGEKTLQKIENVPTWYESPTLKIIICQAGLLNLHCQELVVCKGIYEYIQNHIEDTYEIADFLREFIINTLYVELDDIALARQLKEDEGETEDRTNVRETKRFIRRKEDIEKQLKKGQSAKDIDTESFSDELEDYFVKGYESTNPYNTEVGEEESQKSSSSIERPKQLFYFPLADVPYPEEIGSTHDLKKFIKGHYCLESDLLKETPKKSAKQHVVSYASEIFQFGQPCESEDMSMSSLESDDEKEIRRYIKLNVDRVSFAGDVVRAIARGGGKLNLFEGTRKSEIISDDDFRRFRESSIERRLKEGRAKKVSIIVPDLPQGQMRIQRRPTGYPRRELIDKTILSKDSVILPEEEEDPTGQPLDLRKVRIAPTVVSSVKSTSHQEAAISAQAADSDSEVRRRSVLTRLMNDVTTMDQIGPTLKDYRPMAETKQGNILLTLSNNFEDKEEDERERYIQPTYKIETASFDRVMNIQHGKKMVRKVSSDYVKTLGQIEQTVENSIRSIEFAKKRPSLSVAQYQKKNQMMR
ncbi:Peptidyl-prolyl cis-trans isomerase-like 6 [Papilio machaon]|uniref:Peptidyl-prolyl cis-trans isomerase-like 6 n=1 Tax=Papilio machaon TaxID=76193 RepID=A0A194QY38_PAPMA|nr:Peptidyl-prolyl cis-trans isomerase-like 6 [Papilio machaon]